MQKMDLNGSWDLIELPLSSGAGAEVEAMRTAAEARPLCRAEVPGDVSDALFKAGILPDPQVALNFVEADRRVSNSSWWLRKCFEAPDAGGAGRAVLSLSGLDVHADVWLNGKYLGHHPSAFLPFEMDVAGALKNDANLLLVRLTTGEERVGAAGEHPLLPCVPNEAARGFPERTIARRILVRKPAYSWGWDWSPRMPTCGIADDCEIRFEAENEIAAARFYTRLERGGAAVVRCVAELRRNIGARCRRVSDAASGAIVFSLEGAGGGGTHKSKAKQILVRAGVTVVESEIRIEKPRLWWPAGCGAQALYGATVSLELADGSKLKRRFGGIGLRTVELDETPGCFRFVINGKPVFAKGANWVPPEHLHGTITDARLRALVGDAADCGMNILRVWGGGRFERDAFYDACDERGILVWHDFMSACAPLPGDDPEFAALFLAEARHQARRLASHPSLALWCGNNEVAAAYGWAPSLYEKNPDPGWRFYFEDLPLLIAAEAPGTPYWPTSPYGESVPSKIAAAGTADAAANVPAGSGMAKTGDDHHWVVMRPDSKYWSWPEYWDGEDIPVFNSEYGYGGPCSERSTREYLGLDADAPIPLEGELARQHTNTFYTIEHVKFSIREQYGDFAETPSQRAYLRLGGLCQGLNLGYSLESLRANNHSWGGIFWMYADAWGESGWTIIDHFGRRKISYDAVRRALRPVTYVWRRGGGAFGGKQGEVLLIAINDANRTATAALGIGWVPHDGSGGGARSLQPLAAQLPPFSKRVLATLPEPPPPQLAAGTYIAIEARRKTDSYETYAWRHNRYKDAPLPPASPRVAKTERKDGMLRVTIETDRAAHAISIELPAPARGAAEPRFSDNHFDLWSGIPKTVEIANAADIDPAQITLDWHNR